MDAINEMTKLYKKTSYLDMYGGSVFITILTLIIFFIVFSYFNVMKKAKTIKKDWVNQRCNPSVIPFAGIINKPPNQSAFSYTGDNFNYCLNNILASITNDFIEPIDYVVNSFVAIIEGFINDIQSVRKKFNSLIGNFAAIDTEIMGRILNFLMPIQKMIIKLKDMISKVNAVLVTNLYTIITGYFGIKAFVGSFVKIMIEGLLILIAIIVPLLLFFFTAPIAIPFLVAFGIIAGFTISIIVGLEDIIHMSTSSVPTKPHCFDPNTLVKMNDDSFKHIHNLKLGDILTNNNKVTAIFKITKNEDMYNYNNVIVSGSHNVYENGRWVPVKELSNAKKLNDYNGKILYCLNTEKNIIEINETIFSDWDDIDDFEIYNINENIKKSQNNNSKIYNTNRKIDHNKYNSKNQIIKETKTSYPKNTLVSIINNIGETSYQYIQDIKVGTKLDKDNYVIGVVKLLKEVNDNFKINGNKDIKQKLEQEIFGEEYNLLTSKSNFKLQNNKVVKDYNYNLERML